MGDSGVNIGGKDGYEQQYKTPGSSAPRRGEKQADAAKDLRDPAQHHQQTGHWQSRRHDANVRVWNNEMHSSGDDKKRRH
jgi:hypothetical protein